MFLAGPQCTHVSARPLMLRGWRQGFALWILLLALTQEGRAEQLSLAFDVVLLPRTQRTVISHELPKYQGLRGGWARGAFPNHSVGCDISRSRWTWQRGAERWHAPASVREHGHFDFGTDSRTSPFACEWNEVDEKAIPW